MGSPITVEGSPAKVIGQPAAMRSLRLYAPAFPRHCWGSQSSHNSWSGTFPITTVAVSANSA